MVNPWCAIAYVKRASYGYLTNTLAFDEVINDLTTAIKVDSQCAEAYYWRAIYNTPLLIRAKIEGVEVEDKIRKLGHLKEELINRKKIEEIAEDFNHFVALSNNPVLLKEARRYLKELEELIWERS
jgi:hypothetical protein